MKQVVINPPIESINLEYVNEQHIIIGYHKATKSWDKLSKFYNPSGQNFYQWCGLENSDYFSSSVSENIDEVSISYLHKGNSVYIFDSFDQFIAEFPKLVKLKEVSK
jgi:hypothetical protein